VLTLKTLGGGPPETEYKRVHAFEYVREGDGWRMLSDTILRPSPLPEGISVPADTLPMEDAPPGFKAYPSRRRLPDNSNSRGGVVYASQASPFSDIRLAATATYNTSAAVNYALTYVENSNPAYRTYSNDCTNFTSQALRAGGWPFDQTGGRTEPNTWYYGSFTWTTSYSWAGAHNFNQFFSQSGRGFYAQYFSQLIKGDIVQADWGPTPDGNISHSMIVTDVVNGAALVTYHSEPTINRPLDDIRAENPGTNWYGLHMYSSFGY
jgi:hypothetical protein